jgi:hypothetical protein
MRSHSSSLGTSCLSSTKADTRSPHTVSHTSANIIIKAQAHDCTAPHHPRTRPSLEAWPILHLLRLPLRRVTRDRRREWKRRVPNQPLLNKGVRLKKKTSASTQICEIRIRYFIQYLVYCRSSFSPVQLKIGMHTSV